VWGKLQKKVTGNRILANDFEQVCRYGKYGGNSWNSDIKRIGGFAYELFHIRPSDNLNISAGLALIEVP
jgi:hypothetical protein